LAIKDGQRVDAKATLYGGVGGKRAPEFPIWKPVTAYFDRFIMVVNVHRFARELENNILLESG
jgi:hypothetical protein